MKPKVISLRGEQTWTIDARGAGHGRIYGASKEEVLRKLSLKMAGTDQVEFTDQDRAAKRELGDKGTLLDAVRYYLAHGLAPRGEEKSLQEAGDAWIAELRRRNKTHAFIINAECVLRHLRTYAGATTPVSEITSQTIIDFLASKTKWSAVTSNSVRSRLVGFFNLCLARKWCPEHPIAGKKVSPMDESKDKKPPGIFTVEECRRLLTAAQAHYPEMIPFLVLGLFTGIRPNGEMAKLKPENIKLDRGVVEIPAAASKTRQRRLVELSANALAWLRSAPSLEIVTSRAARRNLIKKANVEWTNDVMRHSFASYHVEKHRDAAKTAWELGHKGSTQMLEEHYKATVDAVDAAAFWNLTPESIVKIVPLAPAQAVA